MSIEQAFSSLRWRLAKEAAGKDNPNKFCSVEREHFDAADAKVNAMSNVELLNSLSIEEDPTDD